MKARLLASRLGPQAGTRRAQASDPQTAQDQLANSKKTVLETDAHASQIKEAYTKW